MFPVPSRKSRFFSIFDFAFVSSRRSRRSGGGEGKGRGREEGREEGREGREKVFEEWKKRGEELLTNNLAAI